jgi:hypothetical protein
MTFFVSLCLLLRFIEDRLLKLVDEFLLDPFVLAAYSDYTPKPGEITGGAENATSQEVKTKLDELEHAKKVLQRKQESREALNDRHSYAGDRNNYELERDLGKELGRADSEIDSINDWIKALIE